ncbi:sodium:calcium antiporter [Spirosoma sp. KUDC1026]|uniref:sodium:calcium antiporter n=1 Tax=Spirosoma sp. KUDC1026 TaxID=2745947 RepID=UPI00159B9BB5|nr:sodium:calcium antiporter [Spirosoma sp. KUDC1026]QKZ13709.1 sodium:calcium antiporter [Spirosoma sp. KUDC1026]
MFTSLSLPVLLLIFSIAAAIVWKAGIALSDTTDVLDKRFNLGEALGGTIVLAIVTNLPEIAITISAAMSNKVELAVGNILGGIALQTVVLVILDAVGIGKQNTLTAEQSSLVPVLEGALVVTMLTLVVMGHQLPGDLGFARLTPDSVLLLGAWVAGVWLVGKAHKGLAWQTTLPAPSPKKKPSDDDKRSTGKSLLIFGLAALATLAGGVALEESGDAMSKQLGMDGVIFGATVLAAATSLPEVSTGLASVRNKDYTLAISDIFGGNAFLPVLLVLATVISGKPVLPTAQKSDIYLTGLGILVTIPYLYGALFRPKRQIARMGLDSFVVLVIYLVGAAGLFIIAK